MSIVVQCPHCETKFNLQAEMIGKSMRCPNLDCRQTFTVKNPGKPVEPPPELPPEPVAKPKPRAAAPAKPAVVEAVIVEAAVVAPPKVKEVVWSEGKDVPPPKGKGKKPVRAEAEDDSLPARRKKEKNRRPWLLIGMSVAVVLVLGFGAFYILRYQSKAEAALAAQAKKEYDETSYPAAAKTYAELVEKYPDSEKSGEYKFFADLASLQVVVRGLTNNDNPEATATRLRVHPDVRTAAGAPPATAATSTRPGATRRDIVANTGAR